MNEALTASILVVCSLVLAIGFLGLMLKPSAVSFQRHLTTVTVVVAIVLTAAGRRHDNPTLEVMAWFFSASAAVTFGLRLWQQHRSPGQSV